MAEKQLQLIRGWYCTSYCNHAHDLKSGMPINHMCYVLPPSALKAEAEGKIEKAIKILERWKLKGKRRTHRGVKRYTL